MYNSVIFDMDGVLADTEPLYFRVNVEFMRERGIEIRQADYERYVGLSAPLMWNDVKARYGLTEPAEELIRAEREAFFRFLSGLPELPPLPGVRELIVAMAGGGVRIGLASSSGRANVRLVLQKTGLEPFFRVVICGEDVTHGKPAPDIFLLAARRLGAAPGDCLVIEDSANGVRAAKGAGMFCVGFRSPHSGNQDLGPADLIVDDFGPAGRALILDRLRAAPAVEPGAAG